MALYINGQEIGNLTQKQQTGGHKVNKPEVPGTTLVPAYFVGLQHTELELTFNTKNYSGALATLEALKNAEVVFYLSDSVNNLYNNQKNAWVVLEDIDAKCSYSADGVEYGEFTMKCTVTTDHTKSTYTP